MKREQTVLFQKWFKKLSGNIQDKITTYIDRVLSGNSSRGESVGSGVYEIDSSMPNIVNKPHIAKEFKK